METFDYTTFLSPFTWRYGSSQMRRIWSEVYKRKLWRKVWVALARVQYEEGLVSKKELDDLIKHQNEINIEKAHKIEAEVRHDLMAEIKTYADQAKVGGGKIHLGATSMDVEDNADAIRFIKSLAIIEENLRELLKAFQRKIKQYKSMPCMGYTHLQPAEPTTVGYRLAFYAQDLLLDLKLLHFVQSQTKGKGMKGAVGTAASYVTLLNEEKAEKLEKDVMKELGLDSVLVSSQTAPRKIEFFIAMQLCSIAQSLYKFAFDLRLMQSPGFGEWQEPFGEKQIGSSTMPFKKNPVKSEQMCSLARLVFHLSNLARDNAANMLLERTLDDSANRRVFFPEMFLALDEMLTNAIKIVEGLIINEKKVSNNLELFGPFAATEVILMEAVKHGADRQEMHEILRELSMKAWAAQERNGKNPLTKFIENDKRVIKYVGLEDLKKLADPKRHTGRARQLCEKLLREMKI